MEETKKFIQKKKKKKQQNGKKKKDKKKKKKKKAPVWNKQFQLSGGSCSLSDIQDYFKYIIKNYEAVTDNPQ